LHESPENGLANDRNVILMSPGVYFTMKIAQWGQNKHHRLGFAGRVPAGDGVILQVAEHGKIIFCPFMVSNDNSWEDLHLLIPC
jgi:hypothetical protein